MCILQICDHVSQEAVWDQILAYSKATKEVSHMVLFQGCQRKTLFALKCFPIHLLLILLGHKINKEKPTTFFLQAI